MILHLSNELIDKRNNLPEFYDFFFTLMTAYKEGKHIISISPLKVKELMSDQIIINNSMLLTMLSSYNAHSKSLNISSLEEYFNVIISITNGLNVDKTYSDIQNKIEYREISYKSFIDSASIQKTILLGENSSDIDIYRKLVEYYQSKMNLNNFNININKKGGGGNTIVDEFTTIFNDKDTCCLCILDSDKLFPSQTNFGETAQKVVNFHRECQIQNNINYKAFYIVLEVLELENILPKDFYLSQYPMKKEIFTKIDQIVTFELNFRKYFDFKKGIECKYEFNKDTQKLLPCKGYLKDFLCPLIKDAKIIMSDNKMLSGFAGRKTNILSDFSKLKISDVVTFVENDSFVYPYWQNLGQYISSHVLSLPSQRAI